MAFHAETHHVSPGSLPLLRKVESDRPWVWLAKGWNDFTRSAGVSMAYGLLVTALMLVMFFLLQSVNSYHFAIALMAGFVFLGPVMAVGLYEVSRRIEHNKPVTFSVTWSGWRRNSRSVLAMGLILVLMMLTWFMMSMQLLAVVYGFSGQLDVLFADVGTWQSFILSIEWPMVIAFGLTGALVVAVTYMLTVVAIPMLTDKEDMDVITAMVSSVRTVKKNPATMLLWAGLIALFTGVAVIPLFLGLIVAFPLLAYASWHAYRDLIEH